MLSCYIVCSDPLQKAQRGKSKVQRTARFNVPVHEAPIQAIWTDTTVKQALTVLEMIYSMNVAHVGPSLLVPCLHQGSCFLAVSSLALVLDGATGIVSYREVRRTDE
jgi:hypothetical protein